MSDIDDYQLFVNKLLLNDNRAAAHRFHAKAGLIHAVVGLSGEAGEVLDLIKKQIFYGKEVPKDKLIEELGDCAFYLMAACTQLGLTLREVQEANMAKLSKRYPAGSFSEKDALARADIEVPATSLDSK